MTKNLKMVFSTSKLKRYYSKCMLPLIIIIILSTVGFSLMLHLIEKQTNNNHIVNVSGRQRMLSQRTTLFALNYALSESKPESDKYRELLKESVDLFEKSHFFLIRGKEMEIYRTFTKAERKIYFEEPLNINRKVLEHIVRMRQILSKEPSGLRIKDPVIQDSIKQASFQLINSLDAIVQEYESKGIGLLKLLHFIEVLIWFTTLCTTFISIFFSFKPMLNRLELAEKDSKKRLLSLAIFYNHEFNNKLATSLLYLENEKEKLGEESYRKITDPLIELTSRVKKLEKSIYSEQLKYEDYSGGEAKIFKI